MNRNTSTEQFVSLALEGIQARLDALQEQLDALRGILTAAPSSLATARAIHPPPRYGLPAPVIEPAAPKRRRRPPGTKTPRKRNISAAGRKAISEATKRRWARVRLAKKQAAPGPAATKRSTPRRQPSSSGWSPDPEERKREMARRMAKRRPKVKLDRPLG